MSGLSVRQTDIMAGLATTPFWRVMAGANKELHSGFDEQQARDVFKDAVDAGVTAKGDIQLLRDNQLVLISTDTDMDLSPPGQGDPLSSADDQPGVTEAIESMYEDMDEEDAALTEVSRVDMRDTVQSVAKRFYDRGVSVEVNSRGPSVAVSGNGIDFFAQGEDANEFIEGADMASAKFSVDPQDWILFTLDSAGAI